MKILSTSASMSRPKSETAPTLRATHPSSRSVMAARMKRASAAEAHGPARWVHQAMRTTAGMRANVRIFGR